LYHNIIPPEFIPIPATAWGMEREARREVWRDEVRKQKTEDRGQLATGSRQQAAGSRQQAAGSKSNG
jgi:hypothetical protein